MNNDPSKHLSSATRTSDLGRDAMSLSVKDMAKVNRVELIDDTGRVYSQWNVSVYVQLQDDGRTLKVFVTSRDKDGHLDNARAI